MAWQKSLSVQSKHRTGKTSVKEKRNLISLSGSVWIITAQQRVRTITEVKWVGIDIDFAEGITDSLALEDNVVDANYNLGDGGGCTVFQTKETLGEWVEV